MAYFGYFKPESELVKIWFQRSGAITCVFALLASLSLLNIKELLSPSGMPSIRHNDFKKKYMKLYLILTTFSVFMTILGTIVWGFGDMVLG